MNANNDADVRLHVKDSGGSGRPVVLIHGWPLSAESWEGQIEPLRSAGYRVIAYDRRGFGHSAKPDQGYDYDTLAADLHRLLEDNKLNDVTVVGFSMGGGEVARYVANHGESRLHSVVFASAVPPYMLETDDNPDGPLDEATAKEMAESLRADRDAFFERFSERFFTAGGELKVGEAQRQKAIELCRQSDQTAALGCMEAFGTTDFREDLGRITVPTLVIHGDADDIVPIEGSGRRTHEAVAGSRLEVLAGAPHGCNVSHAAKFNEALIAFLRE
ncbi:MAG: alpha/beta hydrolase [Burkholderiaceae bacterium]